MSLQILVFVIPMPNDCASVTDVKTSRQSKAGCDALADAVKKQESKIHVLVNNSGMAWGSTWENTPEKEGQSVLGEATRLAF